MAKYEISHTCGHTRTVELFGKYEDRERKIEWLETQECPECAKAREARQSEEIESELGLKPLAGSDKQGAWAKSIRDPYLKQFKVMITSIETSKPEMIEAIYNWLCNKTESKFWIDNRDYFTVYANTEVKQYIRDIAMIYQDLYRPSINK